MPPKRPQEMSAEEKLKIVMEAETVAEDRLGAFLRRKGILESQLREWRGRMLSGLQKPLVPKDACIFDGLSYTREDIELEKLRICDESFVSESSKYGNRGFVFKNPVILKPESIRLLLLVNPIFTILIPANNLYRVIFGRRLFELAAHSLKPTDKISVILVGNRLPDHELDFLNYIDTVVSPSVGGLNVGYSKLYNMISSNKTYAEKTWLMASKTEFAKALGVSRSLLSQSREEHGKKVQA